MPHMSDKKNLHLMIQDLPPSLHRLGWVAPRESTDLRGIREQSVTTNAHQCTSNEQSVTMNM